MKNKKTASFYVAYIIAVIVFGLGAVYYEIYINSEPVLTVTPGQPIKPPTIMASTTAPQPLSLIVVRTLVDQEHGLGDRSSLPMNEGMLFVFPTASNYGIWMKDMQFSIDIISLDSYFNVVHVEPSVSPQTYPTIFYSPSNTRYIIETNAGYAAQNNIKVGDILDFAREAVNK